MLYSLASQRRLTIPTENELKYVLKLHSEDIFANHCFEKKHIRQGYLAFSKGLSLRIRETDGVKFELTFKQKVKDRVVEIEKKIDKRDFQDLWDIAINKLEKIRYNYWHNDDLWEIDAFKDEEDNSYFLMAEHEMPEGIFNPESIPAIIDMNLLYAVPLTDERFASKRIADVKYAKSIYKKLLCQTTI